MSETYNPYDAKANLMRSCLPDERESYERMLGKMSTPLMQEQEYVRRTNRLMRYMGRLKEQNVALRELVELMWQTHCEKPTAYGWIHVMEEAEELGITLEYKK